MSLDNKDDVFAPTLQRLTRSMTKLRDVCAAEQASLLKQKTTTVVKSEKRSPKKKTVTTTKVIQKQKVKPKRPESSHIFPSTNAGTFGLIQESISHNLYQLVIQAILWNQTSGRQARPVFNILATKYPDPDHLAKATQEELAALLQPIGLHNIRAKRCIDMAMRWLGDPPAAGKVYRRKGYPHAVANPDDDSDLTVEFEICHLPGVGPYALDSFRIFHRDEMRGLAKDWLGNGAPDADFEPEWKRVLPLDKELRAYLRWLWLKEDVVWDDTTGSRRPFDKLLDAKAEQ